MFERYVEGARRAVFFARYEASQFGSPYIESEHLLLGLLRQDKALRFRFSLGESAIESMRKQIEDHTMRRENIPTSVDLPLSDECKRVLAYASEEAERLSDSHIGTEHLFLALLREEKSFAAALLAQVGITRANLAMPKDCAMIEAAKAQEALRRSAHLRPRMISRPAFVTMIADEIRELRQRGHSDAAIAGMIHDSSSIPVTAEEITAMCPGRDLRRA